ncbi:LPP20 family lipoprotein [Terasakiella sp. SH-1]|uniref:LPP20 family lipoprotein n=1 Tax=Terasakiella sp. SH-1 TaxID=2560057 RepID=UPI0010733A9F|nr:LPP20 family lipoprotein [Terasakiella sp. SH-1]
MFKLKQTSCLLTALALGVSACSTPEPGTPEAALLAHEQQMEAKADNVEDTIDELPSWYLSPPKDDISAYGVGTATSSDVQMAVDKAMLNAKRSLADAMKGKISSKMKEFVTESGTDEDSQVISEVERVTANLITEVDLSGFMREKVEVKPMGTQYRVYAMIRFPLGKANRIMVDKIKKNARLEAKIRSAKAFQDLEREIQEARNKLN